MSKATCPYCRYAIEICHDDGISTDEDELYTQECPQCDKTFTFRVCISINYITQTAPCLNGEEHSYRATYTYPIDMTMMECRFCGHRRQPAAEEMQQILTMNSFLGLKQ